MPHRVHHKFRGGLRPTIRESRYNDQTLRELVTNKVGRSEDDLVIVPSPLQWLCLNHPVSSVSTEARWMAGMGPTTSHVCLPSHLNWPHMTFLSTLRFAKKELALTFTSHPVLSCLLTGASKHPKPLKWVWEFQNHTVTPKMHVVHD